MKPTTSLLALCFLGLLLMGVGCDTPGLTRAGGDGDSTCQGSDCESDQDGDGTVGDGSQDGVDLYPHDSFTGGSVAIGTDPCGEDANCRWHGFGGSEGTDFTSGDSLTGAMIDADGALTLEDGSSREYHIWIANTSQGTLSKFDTETQVEIARYRTGPMASPDPSRTSVNSKGNVFVGNRGGQSVTKIAVEPNCESSTTDGSIQTSQGPDDIRAWGDDDCVLWHTSLSGHGVIRAVAAQDTSDGNYVWVGGWNGTIWKLDGATGDILLQTSSPVQPYGFALDEAGNLWIATIIGNNLGRIDTARCVDTASCEVEVCGESGDDCIKQRIPTPTGAYGITVDHLQRVWLGGSMMRYDPSAAPGERWLNISTPAYIHGIAADPNGWIYGAGMGTGIIRFNGNDPSQQVAIAGTAGRSVKGVAVDHHDRVWGINLSHNDSFVVEPGLGLHDGQVVAQPGGLVGPYTYSDMTGTQLRFATEQVGIWRHTFQGCHPNQHVFNRWRTLRFEAETPGESKMQWRVRAANSQAALQQAEWIDLGMVPPLSSPVELEPILGENDLYEALFFQVEVRLQPNVMDEVLYVPRLLSFDVIQECPPIRL